MNARLWTPSPERTENAGISRFLREANSAHGLILNDYASLHQWSVNQPEQFWAEVWRQCGVVGDPGTKVLEDGNAFSSAHWFPDATLNFAENLLRYRDDRIALVSLLENGEQRSVTYDELYEETARFAAGLKALGIGPGDRVVGFMPNLIETVVAMLATISLGAIWSSCSPDFGLAGVLDRFSQIQPRVLIGADGYYYNGRGCDSLSLLGEIEAKIPSIERVVVVPVLEKSPEVSHLRRGCLYADFKPDEPGEWEFAQLPFDHPVYIMYSSGTTGVPKCIVHSAGGTLLQHLKEHQLHVDLNRDDVLFYFTTCGWMMWNWLISGLASGVTLVLYDGSPFAGDGVKLLDAIDEQGITVFGTSAKYIASLEKSGQKPRLSHNLGSLRTILSTGSPLSHESFDFVYRDFKTDVCLASISGGTDIISCFVLGCPMLPVHRGEIQVAGLGMAVDIVDDEGQSVRETKGELVCRQPFPSAPIGFWNDADGQRYHAAYFSKFPGVWAQGDYGEITANGGFIIHGRSDAVLNPGGVRIGTAEIYRVVERIDDIQEAIVIGQQWRGDTRIILFIVPMAGKDLDNELEETIRNTIRENATPRHVPAKILQINEVPKTISGKIVELAVREMVHGRPVKNLDALANPWALEQFRDLPALQSD